MSIFENRRKSKVEKSKRADKQNGAAAAGVGLRRRDPLARPRPAVAPLASDTRRLTTLPAFCLLLAAYCLLPSAYLLPAATGLYEIREVKPNVFVWIPDDVLDQESDPMFSRAGTAGFVITPEGVVVVDTANSPFHGRELLYEIRRRTEAPVRFVVDTSPDGDHMLGNEVFVDQQATLISTAAAQAEMQRYQQELARRLDAEEGWRLQARLRGFHVTPTRQTFHGEMTFRLGGQEFKLHSLLSAEDAVVYVPGAKVLFLGELYRNGYFPHVGSRDVRRWILTLRQVEAWDVDVYVPGHGAPGGKKEVAEFRGFLEWVVSQVQTRVRQGKTLGQVKQELPLSETFHWHAPDLATEDVEAVYKQVVGTQTAAASPAASAHTLPPTVLPLH